MPEKIIYTNTNMRGDLQEIIRQMSASEFAPDIIVGVARGGLVPATMLSHYLEKPLMVINYSLRDNKVTQTSEVNDMTRKIKEGLSVLLVDDICDSGDTLRKIADDVKDEFRPSYNDPYKGWESRFKTAVLWNNTSQDVYDPDFVGREISRADDKRWICFPYEEWWKA